MGPVQTLHEFALNLLNDPQALADFDADPQRVLGDAGLGDVSEADVREIIPLVVDTAPASVTEAAGSFAADGDVAGTLDGTMARAGEAAPPLEGATDAATETLSGLPNLSGVFGTLSEVADETGLNTATDGVLNTVSDAVDGVAGATSGVPLAGPLTNAGAIDLQHTVAAIGDHLYDGKLVGVAVDATTNHLGDSLLAQTTVDTVSGLPAVGGPLGEVTEGVRQQGADVLGTVNQAIGSTPVGDPGQVLVDEQPRADDFGAAGDLHDTLDHATSSLPADTSAVPAAPALPAMPAVPSAPAVPDVPAVDDVAAPVTDTVNDVPSGLPAADTVTDQVQGAVGDSGVTDAQHGVAAAAGQVGAVAHEVDDHAHGLAAGNLPGADSLPSADSLPGADSLPSTDDLHLGF